MGDREKSKEQLLEELQALRASLTQLKLAQAEQTQVEQQLRTSECRFRALLEKGTDGILLLDEHWTIRYASPSTEQMLGYMPAELVGRRLLEYFHPEDITPLQGLFARCLAEPGTPVFGGARFRHKTGVWRYLEGVGTNRLHESCVQGIVANFRDTTERRVAEVAQRETEARYQDFVENAPLLIHSVAPDGRLLFVNRTWRDVLGYTDADLATLSLFQIVHPESRAHCQEVFARALAGEGLSDVQAVLVAKDGRQVHIRGGSSCRRVGGMVVAAHGVFRDVTEQKRAEQALQESEERYRELLEAAADAIVTVDGEGRIAVLNVEALRMFGYAREELLGQPMELLVPERYRSRHATYRKAFCAAPQIRSMTSRPEVVGRRKDGSEFPAEISLSPFQTRAGLLVTSIIRDVTERRRAQNALEAAEAKYRAIFENAVDGIFQSTPEGRFLTVNPAGARILGYASPEEAIASVQNIAQQLYVQPGQRDAFRQALEQQGEIHGFECEFYRKDDTTLWASVSARAIRDSRGQLLHYEGTVEDITRRKEVEDQLQRSQQLLELFFSQSLDGFFFMMLDEPVRWDDTVAKEAILEYVLAHERVTKVNDAFLKQYGASREQMLGLTPRDFYKHDLDAGRRVWRRFLDAGRLSTVTEERKLDGSRIWIEGDYICLYDALGRITGHFGIQRDITERRLAEETLRQTEEKYRSIFENAVEGIFQTTVDGRFLTLNPALARLYGYDSADEARAAIANVEHQVYVDPGRRLEFQRLMAETGQVTGFEFRVYRRDGSIAWVSESARAVRGPDGSITYYEGSVEDITARKQAEASLRESEQRFRQMAENIQEVVWLSDPCGAGVLYVSPAYEKIWGRTCASLSEQPHSWFEAIHPDDRPAAEAAHARRRQGESTEVDYRVLRPDRSVRWIRDRGFPIRDDLGRVYRIAGIAEDVTERKHLEEQLRQSQKMDAIGKLAGGVAHDFNNVLTVINGYSDIVMERLPREDPLRDLLAEIRKGGERAAALTRQLLAFSRKQILQPRIVDLNMLVSEMEKMLQRLIGEDILLATALAPQLGLILADPGQVEQVIMNLAVNARDAMPRGGNLTIATQNITLDPAVAHAQGDVSPGPYVLLTLSDSGCGMEEHVKAHLFEPFFTTKELGKGTGLGLATVYGIMKQSGGHIEVASEVGLGTTFRLYFPTLPEAAPPKAPSLTEFGMKQGHETVLLVEDDASVRQLASMSLNLSGYTVLEARDGREALQVSENQRGPIHLLVTDVVMPRMSGRELADRLTPLRPGMKILFLSGYTDDAVLRHGAVQSETAFLQKPFTPAVLSRKVREVLDGKQSAARVDR